MNYLLLASDLGAPKPKCSFFLYTVCHSVLLSCLSEIGITDTILQWLGSYLSDRQQFISTHKYKSHSVTFSHGVPQESVLGPLLFLIYMLPLGQIIWRHGLNFHSYADDTQIYFTIQPNYVFPPFTFTSCLHDLKVLMAQHFLKLNTEKMHFC